MARPGEYADVLRVIGQFLDQQGARNIEIVDQGSYISASWQSADEIRQERSYRAFELLRLREQARRQRARHDLTPQLTTAEILRALGAECDRTGTEISAVTEAADGFRVSGTANSQLFNHTYSPGEVKRLIVEQRARRRSAVEYKHVVSGQPSLR